MSDMLRDHVLEGASTQFDRAKGSDCALFVADWIMKRTGIDPAASLRGTYHDKWGAARQIARFGGYLLMWRVHMAMAGFNTTKDPQEGDVAVVLDAAGNKVSAIRFDGMWVAKSETGVVVEDFRVLEAWSLNRD